MYEKESLMAVKGFLSSAAGLKGGDILSKPMHVWDITRSSISLWVWIIFQDSSGGVCFHSVSRVSQFGTFDMNVSLWLFVEFQMSFIEPQRDCQRCVEIVLRLLGTDHSTSTELILLKIRGCYLCPFFEGCLA